MNLAVPAAVLVVAASCAVAQTETPPASAPTGALPAGVILGHRAAAVDLSVVALPLVEIAPDTGSYLSALGRWSLERGTWPVLIDDGTDRAREDIARFVRAYQPKAVVRLPAGQPVDEATLDTRAEQILRHTWGADVADSVEDAWARANLRPAGVVATNAVDPSWTAAIALAAGRGQPIVWLMSQIGAPGGQTTIADVNDINAQITASLDKLSYSYAELGDDIDALTLCLSIGGRVGDAPGGKGPMALTDLLGRSRGKRWAWPGWIYGSHASSAYMAMSSLFLRVHDAWMFDSYGPKYPQQFACSAVSPLFEKVGFPLELVTPASAMLSTWRMTVVGGIGASLIQVNTAGFFNWFQLADTKAWASEIPMLRHPALVSFTHSFSAQYVNAPNSISGRWLDEGAFGYIGAMDEPTLSAFVPPSVLFARLLAGGAWGYAGRLDDSEPWKVQVIGDPLKTVGPQRRMGELPFGYVEGATMVATDLQQHLKDKDLGAAAVDLVLLGRDADAVRLARSVLAAEDVDEGAKVSVARAALRPAFREKDVDLFVRLYKLLPPDATSSYGDRALLWQILRADLTSGEPAEEAVSLLMLNVRTDSAVEDAAELRPHVARIFGPEGVLRMYRHLIDQAEDDATRQALSRAMGPG